MGKLINKIREFQDLLRSKDKDFMDKIRFSMMYDVECKKYEVKLLPWKNDFNIQDYFQNALGGEEFAKRALEMGVYSLRIGV